MLTSIKITSLLRFEKIRVARLNLTSVQCNLIGSWNAFNLVISLICKTVTFTRFSEVQNLYLFKPRLVPRGSIKVSNPGEVPRLVT